MKQRQILPCVHIAIRYSSISPVISLLLTLEQVSFNAATIPKGTSKLGRSIHGKEKNHPQNDNDEKKDHQA